MTLPLEDMHAWLQNRLARHYIRACRTELEVPKPGNVSIHGAAYGMCAEDFMVSAEASADALVRLDSGLGERIFRAVMATHGAVGSNTNLGIILLAAPLINSVTCRPTACSLRENLRRVLSGTDVADASWVFRAIRLASPGGLGRSHKHDIYEEPQVCLQEAMGSAAQRDRIAYQYANGYEDVVDFMLPSLRTSRSRYDNERRAVLEMYLRMLARVPDSHIERKHGVQAARGVSAMAAELEAALTRSGDSEGFRMKLKQADEKLKMAGLNPGSTADLTVATLLFDYLENDLW
jgi:triphosphoribosyl-dephospho-CoA synthase